MGNLCLTREKAVGDKLPGLRDFEGKSYEEEGSLLCAQPPTEVLTATKKIGKGMFGEVWEAVDKRDGTKVAVKIIYVRGEDHANHVAMEVSTMLHCQSHPNIAQVYGLFTDSAWSELCVFDGTRMWIVQELIESGDSPSSLFDLLIDKKENNRTTTTDDVTAVVRKCASGLAFMHSKGVIHRDIKPENIMIDSNNEVKIVDFGSAMFLPEGDTVRQEALVGSWPYIAPECYRGEYGKESDVFSLACLGVELWLGKDKGPLELVLASDGETPLLSERAVDIMEAEDEQERLEATANLVSTMKQVLLKEARSRLDKKAAASTLVEKRKAKRGQAKKLSSLLQCMLDTCSTERPTMLDVFNDLETLS